jgi:hypothetical protein
MLYTLEQQEAMGVPSFGRAQSSSKEDSASPTFFAGSDSISPNAKQNGNKKLRKF